MENGPQSSLEVTPEGVLTVNDRSSLPENLIIPDSLNGIEIKALEESIFSGCSNLRTVVLPGGIQKIPYYAFDGCTFSMDFLNPYSLSRASASASDIL